MEDLMSKAAELGKMLADHSRFKALMAARDAVRADDVARKLMGDYQTLVERLQGLSMQNKPIEVADKQQLAALEQTVSSNAKIKNLAKAQADFTEMMSRVNKAIYDNLAEQFGPEAEE